MSPAHSIWTLLLLLALLAVPATAQQAEPAAATRGYTVFVGGTVVGREDVAVTTAADGITIASRGRLSGNVDVVVRRAEARYQPDWTPESLVIEASVNGGETALETTFSGDTAVTRGVDGGRPVSRTELVSYRILAMPRIFFGAYEALTRQLHQDPSQEEFRAFVAAGSQVAFRVRPDGRERMQAGTSMFDVIRYELTFETPDAEVIAHLYADEAGGLVRLTVPSQSLDVVRDDLASATARTVVYSNPGDEAVFIPAAGFNLGATLTWPGGSAGSTATARPARLPAVVLVSGSASNDRDGLVGGIPVLGQLAGAMADAGFLAVRYDKRGHGQSGGRAESATLGDFANDVRAIVRWLADRQDVDRDRIAVVGYGEGAWLALMTAAREDRVAAVTAIAAPSTTGAELVMERQRQVLDRLNAMPADRDAKIALQRKINEAVVSGRGWDDLPADLRKQADTPLFQSLLTFDPAEVLEDVEQPLLFLHGGLDMEVPVSHLERITALAREESDSESISALSVPGVNHLLVPAETGDVDEYPRLPARNLSPALISALTGWLSTTLAAVR